MESKVIVAFRECIDLLESLGSDARAFLRTGVDRFSASRILGANNDFAAIELFELYCQFDGAKYCNSPIFPQGGEFMPWEKAIAARSEHDANWDLDSEFEEHYPESVSEGKLPLWSTRYFPFVDMGSAGFIVVDLRSMSPFRGAILKCSPQFSTKHLADSLSSYLEDYNRELAAGNYVRDKKSGWLVRR